MFQDILEHYERSKKQKEEIASCSRRDAVQATDACIETLARSSNEKCQKALHNQDEITKKLKELRATSSDFVARTSRLAASVIALEKAALQFGDIELYLNVLEREIRKIESHLKAPYLSSKEALHEAHQECRALFRDSVKSTSRQERGEDFFRGVVAVVSRLRPGFLIDFIPPSSLKHHTIVDFIELGAKGILRHLNLPISEYCLAKVDDDCFVFLERTLALIDTNPLFLEFYDENTTHSATTSRGHTMSCRFRSFEIDLSPPFTQERASLDDTTPQYGSQCSLYDVGALVEIVRSRASQSQGPRNGSAPRTQGSETDNFKCSVDVTDVGCMPTMNGILLGYPAVFLIHSKEHAQAVSRYLSTSPMTVYTVMLDNAYLMSFSVPSVRTDDVMWKERVRLWEDHMKGALESAQRRGWPFENLDISRGIKESTSLVL